MQRECDRCGRSYQAQRSSSKWCSDSCRAEASMARKDGRPVELVTKPAPDVSDGSLTVATIAALEAAGRVDSPLGQASLALARRVDSGQENGSAVAALVRELRTTLDAALDGAAVADDTVDELRRRREKLRRRA